MSKNKKAEAFHKKALQFLEDGFIVDALEWIDRALELAPTDPNLLSEKNIIYAHLKRKGETKELKSLTQTLKQNKKVAPNKIKAYQLDQVKRYRRLKLIGTLIFGTGFAIGILGFTSFSSPEGNKNIATVIMSFVALIAGMVADILLAIYILIKYKDLAKKDPRFIYDQCCIVLFFILIIIVVSILVSIALT